MPFLLAVNVATEMYHLEWYSTPKFQDKLLDLVSTNTSSLLSKYLTFAGRRSVNSGLVINIEYELFAPSELELKTHRWQWIQYFCSENNLSQAL